MSYPAGVILRDVSFGPALQLEDGSPVEMQVSVRASRSLLWRATGSPVITAGITVDNNADDTTEYVFSLPVTDQDGWGDGAGNAISVAGGAQTHTYTADITYTMGNGSTKTASVGPFALPQGVGTVDIDDLLSAPTTEGVKVAIPDTWTDILQDTRDIAASAASGWLVWDGTQYPARPISGSPVTFIGSQNPDSLGLMIVGDTWIDNTDPGSVPAASPIFGIGQPENVIAAPAGQEYVDYSGANGALRWIKKTGVGTTGWDCLVGDTGWRYLIREASPGTDGWTIATGWAMSTGTHVVVRRIGRIVYCRVIGSLTYSLVPGQQKNILNENMPSGFNSYYAQGTIRTSTPLGAVGFGPNVGAPPTKLCADVPANPTVISYGQASWITNDAWPTTLPGTASNS